MTTWQEIQGARLGRNRRLGGASTFPDYCLSHLLEEQSLFQGTLASTPRSTALCVTVKDNVIAMPPASGSIHQWLVYGGRVAHKPILNALNAIKMHFMVEILGSDNTAMISGSSSGASIVNVAYRSRRNITCSVFVPFKIKTAVC